MDADRLVDSKMMKAATFGYDGIPKEPLVTIAEVRLERQRGSKESWGILEFREPWAKPYKVNATAKAALKLMFGKETDNWIGKRIQLYGKPGTYFGEQGLAVRIKGSPDIREAMSFEVREGTRGKVTYTLQPLGPRAVAPSSSNSAPAPSTASAPGGAAVANQPASGHPAATGQPGVNSPAAGAPAAAPSSPHGAAAPTGPVCGLGPHKKKPLASLDDGQLLDSITFGETKLQEEPNGPHSAAITRELAVIRGELERRFTAKNAPREPGDDRDEALPDSPPANPSGAPSW